MIAKINKISETKGDLKLMADILVSKIAAKDLL